MLQNSSATDIPIAETEERVGKIFRKILTRAHAKQTILANTVKHVSSHVTFLLIVCLKHSNVV